MKEIDVVPGILDLVEKTNGEICILMAGAFAMGFLFAVVLCYCPVRTKLDTARRDFKQVCTNYERKLAIYRDILDGDDEPVSSQPLDYEENGNG